MIPMFALESADLTRVPLHASVLQARQLDKAGSQLLAEKIEALAQAPQHAPVLHKNREGPFENHPR